MIKYIRSKNAAAPRSSVEEPPLPRDPPLTCEPPLPRDPPVPSHQPLPRNPPLPRDQPLPRNSPQVPPHNPNTSLTLDSFNAANSVASTNGYKSNEQKTTCQDIMRGKCNSFGYNVSQMGGPFTFCYDFQNSVCTQPNCPYIHAMGNYGTGYFQEPGSSYQARLNFFAPPPPPPPPAEEPPADIQHTFNVPPPAMTRAQVPTSAMFHSTVGESNSAGYSNNYGAGSSKTDTLSHSSDSQSPTDVQYTFNTPPPQLRRAQTSTSATYHSTAGGMNSAGYSNDFRANSSPTGILNRSWPTTDRHSPANRQQTFNTPPPQLGRARTPTSAMFHSTAGEMNAQKDFPDDFVAGSYTARTLKRSWSNADSHASKYKRTGVEDFTDQPTSHSHKMKKYIRSKNAVASDSPPPLGLEERAKPVVQPPLPLDPPPPDKPPNMALTLKEEIEDVDYGSACDDTSGGPSSSNTTEEFKANESDNANTSKTICRDFFRGKCTRLGTCRFSHKCDVSQLAGVYTFCNDFQNAVCTRPNCKYAHATVFEEQRFYRTGELPPHAFAHYKKVNLLPPPPPPPEDPPADLKHLFKVPPPPIPRKAIKPKPVINKATAGKLESGGFPDDLLAALSATDALNRDWLGMSSFGGTSSDLQLEADQLHKRCKNCEMFDLRMEFMVDKLEKIKKARMDRRQSIKVLSLKRQRLQTTLLTLLRRSYQGNLGAGSMPTSQNSSPDRQKWFLDQLNTTLSSNLISGMPEEPNRGSFNGNQNGSSLLSKLLSAYARQNMGSEASRNT